MKYPDNHTKGICKLIQRSQLFNHKFYKKQLKEKSIIIPGNCILHYVETGAALGLDPSNQFSTSYYLEKNNDVKSENINPLQHYIVHGYSELRQPKELVCQEDYIPYKSIWCLDIIAKRLRRHFLDNNYNISLLLKILKRDGFKKSLINIKNISIARKIYISNSVSGSKYTYISPIFTKSVASELKIFKKKPLISIVMPVYNVDVIWLKKAIKSIQKQWYPNWELCIADDCSTNKQLLKYLKGIKHPKIKIKFKEKNEHISETSNVAISLSTGEFIALMDHDDEITPDALFEVVKEINSSNADFIYSDEDKIDLKGHFSEPHYKPIYSPELFHCQNYISHLTVIKKSFIDTVNGFTPGMEGSQDYDLYLKILEHNPKIANINKVLYHWRKIPGSTAVSQSSKSYAHINGMKALDASLKRRGIKASVEDGKFPCTYNVKYEIIGNPLVSIIIPFKDKASVLETCLKSIEKSTYTNYEIICIDNQSTDKEIEILKENYASKKIRFVDYNKPFNYSAMNNWAVEHHANGEQILFLNNDTEVITKDWIESMLQYSQMEGVGAVGALLLYPNNTIQHAGVILGLGGVANHSHLGLSTDQSGYFGRPWMTQNVSAVTGACLMSKKSVFSSQGFDADHLSISFNDVDLCLKYIENGYVNIYTPMAQLLHYESLSRGKNVTDVMNYESQVITRRYNENLFTNDFYYKPVLSDLIMHNYSPLLSSLHTRGFSHDF